jgi:hypothetical protein
MKQFVYKDQPQTGWLVRERLFKNDAAVAEKTTRIYRTASAAL